MAVYLTGYDSCDLFITNIDMSYMYSFFGKHHNNPGVRSCEQRQIKGVWLYNHNAPLNAKQGLTPATAGRINKGAALATMKGDQ